MRIRPALAPALLLGLPLMAQVAQVATPSPAQHQAQLQERADRFLALVNAGYQALYYVNSEAVWAALHKMRFTIMKGKWHPSHRISPITRMQ